MAIAALARLENRVVLVLDSLPRRARAAVGATFSTEAAYFFQQFRDTGVEILLAVD